jgi:hypothetical protein
MAAEDRTQGRTRTLLAAFAVAWLVLSAVGFGLLIRYGSTPARANSHHPERWPAASAVARSAELPTLVQFIHPRCTCSRASLAELERLMARIAGRAEARVVIVRPHGDEADFQVAALEERVRRIPATRAALDADGRESDAFGAATSGTTTEATAASSSRAGSPPRAATKDRAPDRSASSRFSPGRTPIARTARSSAARSTGTERGGSR